MLDRRAREIELVGERFGELDIAPDYSWLIIGQYPLLPGWNKTETAILILIPPGYPQTPPDNFHTDFDLRLVNGTQAEGQGDGPAHANRAWQQFSWHFVDPSEWQPHPEIEKGHNLLTFLNGVEQRLSELS